MLELFPAIDLRRGRCVRLFQGDFDQETVYADSPLDAARSFVEAGANFLHVVQVHGLALARMDRLAVHLDGDRIADGLEPACRHE